MHYSLQGPDLPLTEFSLPELRLWYPMNGYEQELIVPQDTVEFLKQRAVEHEVGHLVVAAHHKAVLFGIGLGFLPERGIGSFFIQAVYGWENCPTETQCVVAAAGPAADLLYLGSIDEQAASGDLADIERMSGSRSLEPHLTAAKEILLKYSKEMKWASDLLRKEMTAGMERSFEPLPNGRLVAMLVDAQQLSACPY